MTTRQYLEKCIDICKFYEETGTCNDCILKKHSCGVPGDKKEITQSIKAVEDFVIPSEKQALNAEPIIVFCRDCVFRYTDECTAKHERADYDFCSKGKRKEDKGDCHEYKKI